MYIIEGRGISCGYKAGIGINYRELNESVVAVDTFILNIANYSAASFSLNESV